MLCTLFCTSNIQDVNRRMCFIFISLIFHNSSLTILQNVYMTLCFALPLHSGGGTTTVTNTAIIPVAATVNPQCLNIIRFIKDHESAHLLSNGHA